MVTNFTDWNSRDSLQHYGVLGMKWGQRRYQNSDGSLTAAGKKRYEKTGEYGYTYKSHSTKKYDRKVARIERKLGDEVKKNVRTNVDGNQATHTVTISRRMLKLGQKADKYQRRAERSRELDAREQEYAQRVRVGGNIAMRMLTTTIGGKAYQQHLAMNKDTTSTGSKVTAAILTGVGGRLLSSARKANYLRQDERAARRAAKGKSADRGAAFREKAAAAKAAFEQGVNNASNYGKDLYEKNRRRG